MVRVRDPEMHYIEGKVLRVSEKAALIRVEECEGKEVKPPKECWFPKSQIVEYDGPAIRDWGEGDAVVFDCPRWLVEEKELI